MFKYISAICYALLNLSLFAIALAQQPTNESVEKLKKLSSQDRIHELVGRFYGYKEALPIQEAISELEREKQKKYGEQILPIVKAEQVFAALLKFAHATPKSEFHASILNSVLTQTLPKGALLDYSFDQEIVAIEEQKFSIRCCKVKVYLGLDLDGAMMAIDGRWVNLVVFSTPIAITENKERQPRAVPLKDQG